jgi:glycosyltransferase involved in cell wall biosynthesis
MIEGLVSVVVPCYNQGRFLADALDSVLTQSYAQWECLVVNDGSTDDTEQVAKDFCARDSRFKYVEKVNGGLSSARNAGLNAATGEFVQLLDSDDKIGTEKFATQVTFLRRHIHVDIVYSGARYFRHGDPSNLFMVRHNKYISGFEITMHDKDVLKAVLIRNPFVVSAPLFRKSVFDKIGLYDESLRSLEDWDFQIRCAKQGLCFHYLGYDPASATQIRVHDNSMMTNKKVMMEAKRKVLARYGGGEVKPASKSLLSRAKHILKLITPPVILLLFGKAKNL